MDGGSALRVHRLIAEREFERGLLAREHAHEARQDHARDAGAAGGQAGSRVTTDEVLRLYDEYIDDGRAPHEIAGLIAARKGVTAHAVRYHLKKA